MKQLFSFVLLAVLFAAGCSKSDSGKEPAGQPHVTTAAVENPASESAVLGGSVTDADLGALTEVGVQYLENPAGGKPAWDAAMSRTADVAASWSIRVGELSAATEYVVRAFVRTASAAYFGQEKTFTTADIEELQPRVTTADVVETDAGSAVLGGSVADVAPAALSDAGVQYVLCPDAAVLGNIDWGKAAELKTDADLSWSLRATNLTPDTQYAVRAFVTMNTRRYYGGPKTFTTENAARQPLTVAELRARHHAGADVSTESVRGYVALSVPSDKPSESFPAGTVVLYDNTGEPASALILLGGTSGKGIGTAGLVEGDYVEVSLEGARREFAADIVPQYAEIGSDKVRVIDRGHAIEPVWATPAQLTAQAADYVCAPVRVSRVYAETPDGLFSSPDCYFTDGEARFRVYARAGSAVGQLAPNAAMGTLCGICSYDGAVLVVPTKAADVADFTGDDAFEPGDPSIEIRNTEYCEFPPQGGVRVVDCRVTAPAGMRLYADMRHVDASRYSVDIAGSSVRISARPNTTGETADYVNCYIYLAESRDGQRHVPQTIRIAQLNNAYESIPALIQANDGKLASVHEAVVNGVAVRAMKFGSGNYTGHYTSDPTGAVGDHRLTFYAVGWQEADHEAGKLYLRVRGGGEASVTQIPLRINDGATGQAPFVLRVGDEDRYEVRLTGLETGSVIDFSTSPEFDYRKDDRTGRALLFGVQID